jgi:hypothetical protein
MATNNTARDSELVRALRAAFLTDSPMRTHQINVIDMGEVSCSRLDNRRLARGGAAFNKRIAKQPQPLVMMLVAR